MLTLRAGFLHAWEQRPTVTFTQFQAVDRKARQGDTGSNGVRSRRSVTRFAGAAAIGALLVAGLSGCSGADGLLDLRLLSNSNPGYVGSSACTGCHTIENSHFTGTVHARAFDGRDPERSCETCHGPGGQHVTDPVGGKGIRRFTRGSPVPVQEQNAVCLNCHVGGPRIHWSGSTHESAGLACSDCHNPMAALSSSRLLSRENVNRSCFGCHQQQRNEFMKRSHMPLLEGKLSCIDCHNPHGSSSGALLVADTVNDTCYGCHAEKRGPFLWEHAPVRENCLNCHQPHGSNHEKLLSTARPFLCQQCHANSDRTAGDHPNDLLTAENLPGGAAPDPRLFNRSCQNCHAQIHGSNHPSGARFHR